MEIREVIEEILGKKVVDIKKVAYDKCLVLCSDGALFIFTHIIGL